MLASSLSMVAVLMLISSRVSASRFSLRLSCIYLFLCSSLDCTCGAVDSASSSFSLSLYNSLCDVFQDVAFRVCFMACPIDISFPPRIVYLDLLICLKATCSNFFLQAGPVSSICCLQ